MSDYTPSPQFQEAASYLSNSPSLSKVSDAVKLEIYGLFKFITASHSPNSSRPSIFNITGRAKWDAWKQTESAYGDRDKDAEERYLALARELGWVEGTALEVPSTSTRAAATTDDIWDDEETSQRHKSGGMGVHVSMMASEDVRDEVENTPHSLAASGDLEGLEVFLRSHPTVDLNQLDSNGYTALHLASDKGHLHVVELLLKRGVDLSIKDEDEFTAVELARIAEHDDIVTLLEKAGS